MENTTQFAIERDIEIPVSTRGSGTSIYPFALLEVKESFFVPGKEATDLCPLYAEFKKIGKKFTARTIKDSNGVKQGCRVWRIA